ncbi:CDP-alcohol phosphatidyltransferase family protein [Terrisporobacter hibernicus]|uniref:CDP-alcohol phosphatidyltransferase family protein n=1 Tax=Terrisporobacter hibernicus TaxID=2813371 RepID=A0AAX2ZHQ1_9FIRM|nr:CDP-alcohol phosphatidyltransferase family protein [Terrisporobacter hibernicus]UEL48692.1 CDP-alcohol phosphatidyltransferase family protein [Terrisporobacter hibernicus]
MISIKELHKKTLPEYKRQFVKIDYVSYYLWRPICDYMTILFLNTKITATAVTIVSFYSCLLSLACFIFIPSVQGALLGYLLFWIWNISDGIDGNIARYTDTCSKAGDLWDALAGYVAMFVVYFGAGIYAASENSLISIPFLRDIDFCIMGAIAGICTLLPRLIIQKKECVYGKEASKNMKDRSTFGIVKILAVNVISINGVSGLLFLLAIISRMVNVYIIVYSFIMLAFGVSSIYSIMKGLPNE